ncbi:MAG: transcription elongation factor GreA [bacterium]|nr:transcription elongation factor GreA [bacterium]
MKNYITKEGKEKLQKELEYLKKTKRKELSSRIRAAAAMGDLSENFDYQNAKEEQNMTERRIAELEDTLFNTEVVKGSLTNETVGIGSKVILETRLRQGFGGQAGKEKWVITITGPQEADPLQDKISASSPLGGALLGKKKGELVEVITPGGDVKYKILEIA